MSGLHIDGQRIWRLSTGDSTGNTVSVEGSLISATLPETRPIFLPGQIVKTSNFDHKTGTFKVKVEGEDTDQGRDGKWRDPSEEELSHLPAIWGVIDDRDMLDAVPEHFRTSLRDTVLKIMGKTEGTAEAAELQEAMRKHLFTTYQAKMRSEPEAANQAYERVVEWTRTHPRRWQQPDVSVAWLLWES